MNNLLNTERMVIMESLRIAQIHSCCAAFSIIVPPPPLFLAHEGRVEGLNAISQFHNVFNFKLIDVSSAKA